MRYIVFLVTILFVFFLSSCNKIKSVQVDINSNSKALIEHSDSTTTTTVTTTQLATIPISIPDGRDSEYEKRIAFIGDSICSGLKVYPNLLNANQVFAEKNVAAYSINNYAFEYNNSNYNIVDLIAIAKPEIIYIWMGINDIRVTSKEDFAKNLDTLSTNILTVSPDSKIFILSITPTTATHPWKANDKIREYNAHVANFFKSNNNISYLDINSVLSDTNGFLLEVCDGGDGLHLSKEAYNFLLTYVSINR